MESRRLVAFEHRSCDCILDSRRWDRPGQKRTHVAEDETWEWAQGLKDYYYGTYAEVLPSIMCEGLRPLYGAGADLLLTHYGIKIPGVYVAKSLKVATTYPIHNTTEVVQAWGSYNRGGVAGGAVIAADGTYPLRAILRFVAKLDAQVWHRNSNQSLFMPSDLFCTHVVFYAVDAKFTQRPTHPHHPGQPPPHQHV